MSGIKQGFLFIWLSLRKASHNPGYWKYFWLLLLGGIALLSIAWFPVFIVLTYLDHYFWRLFILGLLTTLLSCLLFMWGEIISLPLIRQYARDELKINPVESDKEKFGLSGWLSVTGLYLSAPFIHLFKQGFPSMDVNMLKSLIALEKLELTHALDRGNSIAQNSNLYFNSNLIKANLVCRIINVTFLVLGLGFGLLTGLLLTASPFTTLSQRLGATALAMLIFFVLITIGIAISAFTRSFYAANLYKWIKDMIVNSDSETKSTVALPEMMNQVLSQ